MKDIFTIIVLCALFSSVLLLNNSKKSKSFLKGMKKAFIQEERPQFIQKRPAFIQEERPAFIQKRPAFIQEERPQFIERPIHSRRTTAIY